ncbi:MAG: PPOX class F420-dependent oxidoreductase [Solirubrobacterales bacterium]|nr:PPOX class F420-dependent oxidoreductase [Solirubrobacterales bacterium]
MTALPQEVRALADAASRAHVATIMPDGGPHSVPVWVGVEGERLAFLTHPGSRKARNLQSDTRIAISLTAEDQPFTMAAIRGRVAERLEGDAAWAVIDRIAIKYTGRWYPRGEDRIVFIVQPTAAWGQSFVRTPDASASTPD